jgi:uncharacterized protein YegL
MFGLIINDAQVPLKKCTMNGMINENLGSFSVEQCYINDNDQLLESKYIFPLTHRATITNVTMRIGTRTLKSMLMERNTSSQKYDEAIKNNNRALLLEKTTLGYLIKIGNIEPKEQIIVKYEYFEEMVYDNDAYKLVIPTHIAPHYTPVAINLKSDELTSNIDTQNVVLNIDIVWNTSNTITECYSLTDTCQIDTKDKKSIISMRTTGLTHDFNLFCKTDKMMDCICYDDSEYIYSEYYIKLPAKESKSDNVNIFVLDISGSMEGTKLEQAKQALKLFMRSLDKSTMYNIITFSDDFKLMYDTYQEYNELTLQDTINRIDSIETNGGTEILKPIDHLLEQKITKQTNVFLLTDGQVSNHNEITTHIKTKRNNLLRFFTIGLGNDADRVLCEKIAHHGAGICRMIVDAKQTLLSQSIIELYILSKQEYYYNVKFNFDDQTTVIKHSDFILPNTLYYVFTRSPTDGFVDLKPNMTCINSSTNETIKHSFVPDTVDLNDDIVKKNFYKEFINNNLHDTKLIVDLSIKNNIMCDATSFVIVDSDYKVSDKLTSMHNNQLFPSDSYYDEEDCDGEDWFEDVDPLMNCPNKLLRLEKPLGTNTVAESSKNTNYDLGTSFSFSPIRVTPDMNINLSSMTYTDCDHNKYRPLPKTVDELGLSCKLTIPCGGYSYAHYNAQPTNKQLMLQGGQSTEPKDISEYQKFNGSFTYCDEVLSIIGVTSEYIKEQVSKTQSTKNKVYHSCIQQYLTGKNEYVMILKKLNDYLDTL